MAGIHGAIFKDCVSEISWGAHLCSIYRGKKEQLAVAVPYVVAGLQNNQRCVYVADKPGREDICSALARTGIDVDGCIAKRQLLVLGKEETYLKDGFFSPVAVLDMLINAHYEALRDGYSGLRCSGDLNLADHDASVLNRLMDYEREVNFLFWHNHLIGLCQYNETTVPEDILLGVIYTHPKVVIYGKLYENQFYVPPELLSKRIAKDSVQEVYHKLRDSLIESPGNPS